MHPVVRHEQPASAPLLNLVERVARGGLNHFGDLDLRVSSDHVLQRPALPAHVESLRRRVVRHWYLALARASHPARRDRRVKKASIPIIPSSPTVAASTVAPLDSTAVTEQTPPFGSKRTEWVHPVCEILA